MRCKKGKNGNINPISTPTQVVFYFLKVQYKNKALEIKLKHIDHRQHHTLRHLVCNSLRVMRKKPGRGKKEPSSNKEKEQDWDNFREHGKSGWREKGKKFWILDRATGDADYSWLVLHRAGGESPTCHSQNQILHPLIAENITQKTWKALRAQS